MLLIKSVNNLTKSVSKFFSSINIAAFLFTKVLAFLYWWFSATFGEGMKITGLPTIHNSEIELAPALEIIISASAYAKLISSIKACTWTFSLLFKCLYCLK